MNEKQKPGLLLSLIPVVFLIVLMIINVMVFKDDATGGANQLALVGAGVLAALFAVFKLKQPYKEIEKGIARSIDMAMMSCLILLIIGSLIGSWILSGIVPTIIFYGFKIIVPAVFLPVACLSCGIVALATGSSWTTTGTIGIALIAIGQTYGIPEGMVAGAIISGAYFGDKMSPLSDTTNLAPAMVGTDLFSHIRHMMFTSGPAMVLALIGFSILGFFYSGTGANPSDIAAVSTAIESNFSIGPHLLIVPVLVLIMVAKKVPAIPALLMGTLLGVVTAAIFQQPLLAKMAGGALTLEAGYQQIVNTLVNGFSIESGNKMIDSLFSRGGMSGMLSTIWLILCAMVFGGVLEATGMLQRMAQAILSLVRGTGSLVGATLASCLFTNATASDQYIAIVLPGRMFRKAYEDYNLHPKNLSRAIEDAGTVTSVLVPWNSGGAYNAGVLGVPTLTYLPFCFFNLLSPLVSLFLASMNWTIERIGEEQKAMAVEAEPVKA